MDAVAALRISVFRAWPCLYDGDKDYERRYLQVYSENPNAILAGVFDGERLVGAATGTPLEDYADDFVVPFMGTGLAVQNVFYCVESILLPEYRGRGLGHAFFDAREGKARSFGGMNQCPTLLRSSPGKILTRNMRPKSRFSSG